MNRTIPFFETPIVLAPLGGPGSVELTAAACNARAFGFLASQYSDPQRMRNDIERLRSLTDKPFGVNLFIDEPWPRVDADELSRAHHRLDTYREELGIPAGTTPPQPPTYHDEQIRVVLETRPRAFSFTLGIPPDDVIAEMKRAGIFTIGTATTVEEAVALREAGIDAISAQGAEAGGHRGTFLHRETLPLIGTIALVPQVVDAVEMPVIAAGGIGDGRGIAAALALGAAGVQMGTAFLLTAESKITALHRQALKQANENSTTLTNVFTGRPARSIVNRMIREVGPMSADAPAFPLAAGASQPLRAASEPKGSSEFMPLWSGQAPTLAREMPAGALVARLVDET